MVARQKLTVMLKFLLGLIAVILHTTDASLFMVGRSEPSLVPATWGSVPLYVNLSAMEVIDLNLAKLAQCNITDTSSSVPLGFSAFTNGSAYFGAHPLLAAPALADVASVKAYFRAWVSVQNDPAAFGPTTCNLYLNNTHGLPYTFYQVQTATGTTMHALFGTSFVNDVYANVPLVKSTCGDAQRDCEITKAGDRESPVWPWLYGLPNYVAFCEAAGFTNCATVLDTYSMNTCKCLEKVLFGSTFKTRFMTTPCGPDNVVGELGSSAPGWQLLVGTTVPTQYVDLFEDFAVASQLVGLEVPSSYVVRNITRTCPADLELWPAIIAGIGIVAGIGFSIWESVSAKQIAEDARRTANSALQGVKDLAALTQSLADEVSDGFRYTMQSFQVLDNAIEQLTLQNEFNTLVTNTKFGEVQAYLDAYISGAIELLSAQQQADQLNSLRDELVGLLTGQSTSHVGAFAQSAAGLLCPDCPPSSLVPYLRLEPSGMCHNGTAFCYSVYGPTSMIEGQVLRSILLDDGLGIKAGSLCVHSQPTTIGMPNVCCIGVACFQCTGLSALPDRAAERFVTLYSLLTAYTPFTPRALTITGTEYVIAARSLPPTCLAAETDDLCAYTSMIAGVGVCTCSDGTSTVISLTGNGSIVFCGQAIDLVDPREAHYTTIWLPHDATWSSVLNDTADISSLVDIASRVSTPDGTNLRETIEAVEQTSQQIADLEASLADGGYSSSRSCNMFQFDCVVSWSDYLSAIIEWLSFCASMFALAILFGRRGGAVGYAKVATAIKLAAHTPVKMAVRVVAPEVLTDPTCNMVSMAACSHAERFYGVGLWLGLVLMPLICLMVVAYAMVRIRYRLADDVQELGRATRKLAGSQVTTAYAQPRILSARTGVLLSGLASTGHAMRFRDGCDLGSWDNCNSGESFTMFSQWWLLLWGAGVLAFTAIVLAKVSFRLTGKMVLLVGASSIAGRLSDWLGVEAAGEVVFEQLCTGIDLSACSDTYKFVIVTSWILLGIMLVYALSIIIRCIKYLRARRSSKSAEPPSEMASLYEGAKALAAILRDPRMEALLNSKPTK